MARTTAAVLVNVTRQKSHWRDYQSTTGPDPRDVLQGPTPEEGSARGQAIILERKPAPDQEFSLEHEYGTRVAWPEYFQPFGDQQIWRRLVAHCSQRTEDSKHHGARSFIEL